MDKRLSDLLDKQSIYEVLVRYCRGADRCDEATLRSVYHEDASDDHGYWRGSGYEFAAFLPGRLGVANSATTHSISNVLIELQGDTARSEAQVLATLVREGTDPVLADVMGARYLDRLSRRDGEWRIARLARRIREGRAPPGRPRIRVLCVGAGAARARAGASEVRGQPASAPMRTRVLAD